MIKVKTFPIPTCSLIIYLYIIVVNCQKPSGELTVTPEKYVDDKKPYMEFTCEAYLDKGDKLSWSMTKNKKQETVALYEESYGNGTKGLDLQWPLTPDDNKAEIFCFKEKTVNGKPSTTKSKKISIRFETADGPQCK
ncbi:uncharacterized protein LOC134753457 [Cydia strobilella]|uniref:uncharacterized protein LOC134753457 n=1 Tax=Cydia strobilella TaxID=1100964 RepID=UPI0030067653